MKSNWIYSNRNHWINLPGCWQSLQKELVVSREHLVCLPVSALRMKKILLFSIKYSYNRPLLSPHPPELINIKTKKFNSKNCFILSI